MASSGSESEGDEYLGENVHVQGAGLEVVNGVYWETTEVFDTVGKYTRVAPWQNQNHEFSLFRCNTSNGAKHWYISIVPLGVQPGTSSDTDFYSAPMSYKEPSYPPVYGWSTASEGKDPPPTIAMISKGIDKVPVVKPDVVAAYEEILFSEEHSDVQFICPDGQAIPAHKNILAASSPYFKAAFSSRWEGKDKEKIKTTFAAHIIKAMLSLLYAGKVDEEAIEKEPVEFIKLSSEYDLKWLKEAKAEPCCIRATSASNLKDMWQIGRLYESEVIKNACIAYTKRNTMNTLVNSTVQNLRTEDPASWEEFSEAISLGTRLDKRRYV